MISLKSQNFYLFLMFASVTSSFIFCVGFFPYSNVHKSSEDITEPAIDSIIDRSILMIIDALRIDFIENESFTYLHELLANKEACLLKLRVGLPTVTKPCIKAMTSGKLPSFLDIVSNLKDSVFEEDTFIRQLTKRNHKIVSAGDDIWNGMFKGSFIRSYGNTDSLFVNDFYEGDLNVTRALEMELKQKDWKLLVLHYLGLDHIGHVEGPFSKLVSPKIKEMDEAIKKIHLALKEWNSNSIKKSILVLTGDHGMRDSGGHSSNSFAETHVPLVIIGNCESNSEKFYKQIDFAPTFSILNGLTLPASSIGTLIPELISNLTQIEKLDRLRIVNEHLMNMAHDKTYEDFKFQFEKAQLFHKMFKDDFTNQNAYSQAEKNYFSSSTGISDKLALLAMEVNIFHVLLGLSFNVLISITLLIPSDDMTKDLKVSFKSFIPFVLGGIFLKPLLLNEVFLLSNDLTSYLVIAFMSCLLRIVIGILNIKRERIMRVRLFENDLLYLSMLGQFLFIVSVGSSSFVEEEHQIWYYFCNAMFCLLAVLDIRGRSNIDFITVSARYFGFLLLHIVIRRMNATGDKWINVPDLSDYLDANQNVMNVFIAISLVASAMWLIAFHCTTSLKIPFIVIGNILLYFHHTRSISERNDLTITNIFWLNIFVMLAIDIVCNLKKPNKTFNLFAIFFLVSLLLHQPQNVVMGFACAVTCWFFDSACNRLIKKTSERVIAKIFLHIWAGKLFFFYQGNSNSLATVDVNAGFVGQMHTHLPIIFIFTTINTFNGQLMSLNLLVLHLFQDSKRLMDDTDIVKQLFLKWLSIISIIPAIFFQVVITTLRNHLFIWTVFSPKLLYDVFQSVLLLFVMLIVKLTINFH